MVKKTLKIPVYTGKQTAKEIKLPKSIFDVKASEKLLTQYVYIYLTNKKRNVSTAQSRGEVNATTRKLYRQKGTGRARHGSKRAPIFKGGGVAHGPLGIKGKLSLTKKMKRKALFYSLSLKALNNQIHIVSDLLVDKLTKTKEASTLLEKMFKKELPAKNLLLVLKHESKAKPSLTNINYLLTNEPCSVNAYLVMKARKILFTESSLNEFISLFNQEQKQ